MSSRKLKVQIERVGDLNPDAGYHTLYGVGRRDSHANGEPLVVLPLTAPCIEEVSAEPDQLIELPSGLGVDSALAVPPLAIALWIWDVLGLELGDCAALCGDYPHGRLLAKAALWRGAIPVIHIHPGQGSTPLEHVERLTDLEPQSLHSQLAALASQSSGFAAVDLCGRPDLLDVLFETLPRNSRLMMAANGGRKSTIDFYNNVHRKGVTIHSCVLDTRLLFDRESASRMGTHIERAARILSYDAVAEDGAAFV